MTERKQSLYLLVVFTAKRNFYLNNLSDYYEEMDENHDAGGAAGHGANKL
ncbi:hypothetical protein [uncultured Pontibacter sp.]|nr:hypothetical protein [uncultured Pontibacter sp.]